MKNKYPILRKMTIAFVFCLTITQVTAQNNAFWQNTQERNLPAQGTRYIVPTKYQTLTLDVPSFLSYTTQLRNASGDNVISLPMPDGSTQKFSITETQMLAPELASKLPDVRTFTAQGIDDATATAYLDWTMQGFHGMILSANGTAFIDPYSTGNNTFYIAYYKVDYYNAEKTTAKTCQTFTDEHWLTYKEERDTRYKNRPFGLKTAARPSGSQKRTYRAAIAATIEYSNFHGGKTQAQNAIITTMNRVRGVYEKEVGISFTLVDNSSIVFVGSDTFDNDNAGLLINQSQTIIDGNIGAGNYDIGHTVSTGGGGLAGLGVVCRNGQKARGITGSPAPVGDAYDIDYVAHEVGHQFGGEHTFNGNVSNCAGSTRSSSSAYETGSGSTIMAYAGICGSTNIQNNSDAYFHTKSYDDILDYSVLGAGDACPTKVTTNNAIPVLTMPTGGFTIPKGTSFALTASATDANAGDVLSYCWEQFDLGAAGGFANSGTSGPSFRSFSPVASPTRHFPRTSGNPNLSAASGETLPAVGRAFNFRCTVRDNQAIGGVEYGTISFNVSNTIGPLAVTAPNVAATIWQGGSTQTVIWSVNATNTAPVNCTLVNILLSTDGGLTYPTTLFANAPNDGSQLVVVPNVSTSSARVKVQAVGNIFFDISDANFSITLSATPTFTLLVTPDSQIPAANVVYQVQLGALNGFSANVSLSVAGNPAGTTAVFGNTTLAPTGNTTLTIGNAASVTGISNITITATSGAITRTATVKLDGGNLPPVAANASVSIPETLLYTFKASDFTANYAGGNPLQSIRISAPTIPNNALLELGATPITGTQSVSLSALNGNLLRFTPVAGLSGANYASFDFEVFDGTFYSTVKYKMTINVIDVNDIPIVTVNTGLASFPQAATTYTIGKELLQATDVEDAAPTLTFTVTAIPSAGKLLLNGLALDVNNTFLQSALISNALAYQPNTPAKNTTDMFSFRVSDSQGGTTTVKDFAININENTRISDGQIVLYPNPADTKLTLKIDFPSSFAVTLQITDMLGKDLRTYNVRKDGGLFLYDIKINDLANGAYILHIKSENDTWIRKFVIATK